MRCRIDMETAPTLLSEIKASAWLTRLELARDLMNANRETIIFSGLLINANFESQNKSFDLLKKLTLLLENINNSRHKTFQ